MHSSFREKHFNPRIHAGIRRFFRKGRISMAIREIPIEQLDTEDFIAKQVKAIRAETADGFALSALSGGVDSAVVTLLAHRALGTRLKSYFIDTGLMRENEPQQIVDWFTKLGIKVEIFDAAELFFEALRGLTDPEEKREQGITQVFYKTVFPEILHRTGARVLLQGTNYTDVQETAAGIKRQHNVFAQIGIDPEKEFGYKVYEPILNLRKPAVRAVGRALGMPAELAQRPPFPGPALATRIIGEVTRERVAIARQATIVVEQALRESGAFQYMAILHEDRVTGIRDGKREFGHQIEIRCWDSEDAVTAVPTTLPFVKLRAMADRLTSEVPEVVSVTYNITAKPPSCIEAV